ncbi:hypothetical protein [Sunxiuqinia elliptica]|jgi:hypothetical protein|uniref:Uncharacterized protein n=1 Tax=Sunxiuqinia elliptica TaxID=655355 RepID=A0A4R6HAV0_9BACT|nr:hypothetical protein [Sunxiuqinia elliptica]TDO04841.1 hypothetical protein DET52_101192 [Sunxiuqinia elliptica]TDO64388.1 hypothetical protein DET65_0749 [Sunxiuqinia elliptica]
MIDQNDIKCANEIEGLKQKFINNGWITVSDEHMFCALADNDSTEKALTDYCWELRPCETSPEEWDATDDDFDWDRFIPYTKISDGEFEPLIYHRELHTRVSYRELSEDFIHFHNLHLISISSTNKKYISIDSNGDEEDCVVFDGMSVKIRIRLVREYLYAKQKNLLIFIDRMHHSKLTYAELGITPEQNVIVKEQDFIYNYSNTPEGHGLSMTGDKSTGWVVGKCVLRYSKPNIKKGASYEDFIIATDEDGEPALYTCEETKLRNGFGANPDAPDTLTPIYFKKEVLDKYYSSPDKYLVDDGYLHCGDLWGLRIDNNREDYVIVMLYELSHLHPKEQQYWKGYNVAPPLNTGLSGTSFVRWICGNFSNPTSPDLKFKYQFAQINKEWEKQLGWKLFLPLVKEDQHRFETLHSLTKDNNDQEFDEQVLSIVKITIDSFNQKELVKNIDESNPDIISFLKKKQKASVKDITTGIDKFEIFLLNNNFKLDDLLLFLRKTYALRSFDVAHRKSSDKSKRETITEYFNLSGSTKKEVLNSIFTRFTELFLELDNFLKSTHNNN